MKIGHSWLGDKSSPVVHCSFCTNHERKSHLTRQTTDFYEYVDDNIKASKTPRDFLKTQCLLNSPVSLALSQEWIKPGTDSSIGLNPHLQLFYRWGQWNLQRDSESSVNWLMRDVSFSPGSAPVNCVTQDRALLVSGKIPIKSRPYFHDQ